jgi:hypothetical protein
MIYTLWVGSYTFLSLSKWPKDMLPNIAPSLQRQIPPGSQVFTTDWPQTGTLMLTLPDRRFMVALDPHAFLLEKSRIVSNLVSALP